MYGSSFLYVQSKFFIYTIKLLYLNNLVLFVRAKLFTCTVQVSCFYPSLLFVQPSFFICTMEIFYLYKFLFIYLYLISRRKQHLSRIGDILDKARDKYSSFPRGASSSRVIASDRDPRMHFGSRQRSRTCAYASVRTPRSSRPRVQRLLLCHTVYRGQ